MSTPATLYHDFWDRYDHDEPCTEVRLVLSQGREIDRLEAALAEAKVVLGHLHDALDAVNRALEEEKEEVQRLSITLDESEVLRGKLIAELHEADESLGQLRDAVLDAVLGSY